MKPMKQVQPIYILLSFSSSLHKNTSLHSQYEDRPSYTFQHSPLTREVFIQVHGHFQTEESNW